MKLSFDLNKIDKTWEQYSLYQVPITYQDKPTKYKAIIYHGRLVAIMGRSYKLLPNEEAIKIANQVAERVDAEKFEGNNLYRDNLFYNKKRTVVHATYLLKGHYEIDGRDTVRVGFSIANSIDGTLGFGCEGFTFRRACSNGVLMGYKQITSFYRKHTKRFEVNFDKVLEIVNNVIQQVENSIKVYAKLVQLELNEEIAEQIAKSPLPRKLLPDYIETEKDKLVRFDPSKTLWDVYNDITASIWHNTKADIETKRHQFDMLHAVIKVI